MGTNKKSSFENVRYKYFAMAKKNTDKVVFHQIKVIDAKGVSVAKPLMAKCLYQT
jgi:uncharacterized protein YnzC (UPF0291/DUF896 family)